MSDYDEIVSRHVAARDSHISKFAVATTFLDDREPPLRDRYEAEGRSIAAALTRGAVPTIRLGHSGPPGSNGSPVAGWQLIIYEVDGWQSRWYLDTGGRWVHFLLYKVVSPTTFALGRDEDWLSELQQKITQGRDAEVMLPTTVPSLYGVGDDLFILPAQLSGSQGFLRREGRAWRREYPGEFSAVLAVAVRRLVAESG